MLRQVFQGAQRHQHAAYARYFPSALRSPFVSRPLSFTASRFVEHGDSGDKVHIFEQDTIKSKRRVELDPETEDHAEQEEVKNQLAELDRELEILRQGPYSPNSPFMQQLPEADRAIALEAMRKFDEEHGPDDQRTGLEDVFDQDMDDMLREEFEGLAKEEHDAWGPKKSLPETTSPVVATKNDETLTEAPIHPYQNRFNQYLATAVNDSDSSTKQELWRWYQRCKQTVPSFLASLSPQSARALWDSQFKTDITVSNRLAHLQTLVEDFRSVGRNLSPSEILMYVEALYDGGRIEQALDIWEAQQTAVSQGEGDVDSFWKLGVRLFAGHGDPQRAQDIAFAFLMSNKSLHPRILIPVIIAWAGHSDKAAANKAWALYLQLKTLLGRDMTMDDYDAISVGLIKAEKIDLGVAVFKDMMVTGKYPAHDSTALFGSYVGLAGNLQASSITEQDVNNISLSTLTILPRRFQNRFFYASWMKKLIGMGEIDSAASVVELMYERGIKPDAKHLNGLIGAWLRRGTVPERDKAERLAWSMIQHRIDLVWDRDYSTSPSTAPSKASVPQASDLQNVPRFLQRDLPQANIETFCILLLHYTRRGDDDMVKYLTKCLGDAQMRPNSYFMNHLLYSELRKHDIHTLWQKYESMRAIVQPDLETYACLWDCGKLQYDGSRKAFDPDFPTARNLFSEMMRWFSQLTPRGKRTAQEEFSKDLYDQITRCFCLSKDLPGTVVALYAMRDLFQFYPDDDTARLLVLQVARMAGAPAGTSPRALRRLKSTPRSKENVQNVYNLLEILNARKTAMLKAQGLSVEQLDDEERRQFQLEILAELLVSVMERTTSGPDQVRELLAAAVSEMSAGEVDLGQLSQEDPT